MGSDLYEKMTGELSGVQWLMSKIPGLSGYMEKGRRREADQLLRETLAAQLETVRLQLSTAYEELSRDIIKAIDYAEPLGRVDTRLMGLIGKIKDAPQGYAGFFDAIKVKEDDLSRIYQFDEGLIKHGDLIASGVAAVSKAVTGDGDLGPAIRDLDTAVKEANEIFGSRDRVIMDIS